MVIYTMRARGNLFCLSKVSAADGVVVAHSLSCIVVWQPVDREVDRHPTNSEHQACKVDSATIVGFELGPCFLVDGKGESWTIDFVPEVQVDAIARSIEIEKFITNAAGFGLYRYMLQEVRHVGALPSDMLSP